MSTLRLTTISNQGGTDSVPSQTVISGSAKAWVNFNGTGTVAIRASFNVSSITDNGTGSYTVNFTNSMTDANYSAAINCSYSDTNNAMIACLFADTSTPIAPTTSGFRFTLARRSDGTNLDSTYLTVSVFR